MVATAAGARSGRAGVAAAPARRAGAAVAGPILIVAAVLFALRGYALRPDLTNAHPDILGFWLPRYAFLGRSLAAGHLPLWNPFEMAGYRFAADPQSGWLYAPAMLLFSTLSPWAAMRALIVLNPLLCGLGLYAFLRTEGLARATATAGGLSAAMIIATSWVAVSLPFAGTLAWTAVALLGTAGYRRAGRWSQRLLWLGLGAFSWLQVANAHMSHGLVTCTLLVGSYVVAATIDDIRSGRLDARTALGRAGLFLASLPTGSLAVLIPRLAFIHASSLHAGYTGVAAAADGSSSGQGSAISNAMWPGWPLALGAAPGAYAGTAILLAAPLAIRARRWRHLVWGVGVAFAIAYVATLHVLVGAGWFQRFVLRLPLGDVYVHNAGRFRYAAVMAIPILGAVGLQSLLDAPPPARRLVVWLGWGVLFWAVLPVALGGAPVRFVLLAVGAAAVVPILTVATVRTRAGPALVAATAVLACELLVGAEWSQRTSPFAASSHLTMQGQTDLLAGSLPWPRVSETAFLSTSPFTRILGSTQGRYLTWDPPATVYEKGYLYTQRPTDWPALVMERGTLFGLHDTLGYNPVQLLRYWTFIRAANPLPIYYNASVLAAPTTQDLQLLGVRYLIAPRGASPPVPTDALVATDRGYDLWEVAGWDPRVSVVPTWSVASGPTAALRRVLTPGFDPTTSAFVEGGRAPGSPGERAAGAASTSTYAESDPENITVSVDASSAAIVLVRNVFDPGWSATVDGRPARILPTDYLMQGVAVGAGRHVIRLTYRDRAVTDGVRAGMAAWLLLIAMLVVAFARERRRRTRSGPA